MFSPALAFTFTLALGLAVTLDLSLTCSVHSRKSLCIGSCGGLLFMYSCFKQNTVLLCARFANTNYSIPQTFTVHHARFEIRGLCAFFFALRATTPSKVVWHSKKFSTFHWALTNWSDESTWTPLSPREKLLGCIPVILQFPGQPPFSRAQTGLIRRNSSPHRGNNLAKNLNGSLPEESRERSCDEIDDETLGTNVAPSNDELASYIQNPKWKFNSEDEDKVDETPRATGTPTPEPWKS